MKRPLKLVCLGDRGVGKTAFIQRITKNAFDTNYKQTYDIIREVVLLIQSELGDVHFNLWDIGGDILQSKMMKNFMEDCDCVFLFYDITSSGSFRNLKDYKTAIKKYSNRESISIMLIGTKSDLQHLREIKGEDHERIARSLSGAFLVSAKTKDSLLFPIFQAVVKCLQIDPSEIPIDNITQNVVKAVVVAPVAPDEKSVSLDSLTKEKPKCLLQ